jgi:2-keto-4-pentenoate hydratase
LILGNDDAAAIAGHFLDARRLAAGLPAYPGALPETLEEAYAIQDHAIRRRGGAIIGWKIGRILPPLSERFGSDRLIGPIFAGQSSLDGDMPEMPVFAAGFAAGEAEFLLRIGRAPAPGRSRFSLEETAELIDAVHVGIEVASSPLGAINRIGPIAVISDFGNNNGLVIGSPVPDWQNSGFEQWEVATMIDGELAGTGRAAAFPDGALGSARFLFQLAARRGIALRAGQWISSGAVTGVHDARPGQIVEARFSPDHLVRCRLGEMRPA